MGKSFENLVRDIQSKLHVLFIKKSDSNPGRLAMLEATKIPWYKMDTILTVLIVKAQ